MVASIVMIPGLGSDAAVWQPTIDALGTDADCIVGDTLSDTSLPGMAARILMQAPDRFALAGVSMGGMVALEIMRRAPERVTRLALLDTNANTDTSEQRARRESANAAMANAKDLAVLARPALRTCFTQIRVPKSINNCSTWLSGLGLPHTSGKTRPSWHVTTCAQFCRRSRCPP